mmetsp:Transcript_17446/g.48485  ORF Transcript_17446/g.48485 Transcript_17446/m.48485 type:complete len:175 (+) Transcript_17446:105-629(+)
MPLMKPPWSVMHAEPRLSRGLLARPHIQSHAGHRAFSVSLSLDTALHPFITHEATLVTRDTQSDACQEVFLPCLSQDTHKVMPAIRLLCHDLCYAHYKAFLAGLSLDTAGLKPGPLLSSRWLPDAGARLLLCNAEGATSKRGFTLRSPTWQPISETVPPHFASKYWKAALYRPA